MSVPQEIKVLFSAAQIASRVKSLGRRISRDYKGKRLVIVSILKGSFVFLADLIRQLKIPLEIDFMQVSSYGKKTVPEGTLRVLKRIKVDVNGKDVLLVDDIVDTGHTASFLLQEMKKLGARQAHICTLLSKPSRRKFRVPLKYVGFTVADKFVVGYGLDFAEDCRQLPFIGEVKD